MKSFQRRECYGVSSTGSEICGSSDTGTAARGLLLIDQERSHWKFHQTGLYWGGWNYNSGDKRVSLRKTKSGRVIKAAVGECSSYLNPLCKIQIETRGTGIEWVNMQTRNWNLSNPVGSYVKDSGVPVSRELNPGWWLAAGTEFMVPPVRKGINSSWFMASYAYFIFLFEYEWG